MPIAAVPVDGRYSRPAKPRYSWLNGTTVACMTMTDARRKAERVRILIAAMAFLVILAVVVLIFLDRLTSRLASVAIGLLVSLAFQAYARRRE